MYCAPMPLFKNMVIHLDVGFGNTVSSPSGAKGTVVAVTVAVNVGAAVTTGLSVNVGGWVSVSVAVCVGDTVPVAVLVRVAVGVRVGDTTAVFEGVGCSMGSPRNMAA